MDNKSLISQYVDTGVGIPEYQFNQLSNNDKKTYLRKIEMSLEYNPSNVKFYYGVLPEDKQLELVEKLLDGDELEYIKNPTDAVKLAAVKKYPFNINYIENPSEELILIAIGQNYRVIRSIKNPSEEAQLAAIRNSVNAIALINNPTETIQLRAVNTDPKIIQQIKNPTEDVQMAAVKKDNNAIWYIQNQSEAVQIYILKKAFNPEFGDYSLTQHIRNPSEKVIKIWNKLQDKMVLGRINKNG